jgi:N-acetylglucosaminyldiphosphoundecaprenol N-acetyl-beta-D-mannosaminyltransferase
VVLCNVLLHSITEAECVRHICDELGAGRGGMVVTPNLDHLRRYGNDVNFGALVAEAELVVADGMPLVWASRLQGTPLPERVAGSNLISSLSGAAAERGFSIYLLGGAPGTAVGAGEALRARFPSLKVVGTYCPPFGFDKDPKQMADIIQSIVAARPDVVYVALGSPKQERLIAKLRHVMPSAWWLGVGNSFSFLCGDVRRAPLWMQNIGMEWAHRLCQEPRRLFKRYLVSGVPFAGMLLTKSALIGVRRRLGEALFGKEQSAEATPTATAAASTSEIHAAPDAGQVSSVPSIGVGLAAAVATAEPARQSVRHALAPDRNAADLAASLTATPGPGVGGDGESRLARLRALVLLGGSVRPTALSTLTGRSTLDLPLDDDGSVLNHWLAQGLEVAKAVGLERLPVRVMVNHHSYDPASADPKYYGTFRVERDLSEYRGTGGVLRDLANDYDDDDLILVANGRQVLLDPLPGLATWLARVGGDVSVVAHEDGTPSGLMLVQCKALRLINDAGFCDMKEQALPRIAKQFDVRVAERRRPTGLPIRSLEDYILALRCYHRRRAGKPASVDPLAEDWSSSFALVEPGAGVDPSARLHDSVVLRGARVEPGAVLVRSVIAADGVVRHDKTAVDQIICGATERHARRRRRKTDARGRASRPTPVTTGNALTELRA